MKSPFKFLDSYTKDDRNIFFGRDRDSVVLRMFLEYIISPLQGLKVWRFMRWTLSNAWVFSAFSANRLTFRNALKGQNIIKPDSVLCYETKYHCALKGQNIIKQDSVLCYETKYHCALKGQNIIKQDSVLFNMNIMIISPVRA
jgi:hypothetical protein